MSILFTIFLILTSLVSFPSWCETKDDLVIRAGLYYKKFTATPFTGEVEGRWRGSFKNGKKDSHWEYYWDNEQLYKKGNHENGKEEGSWETYFDDGQLWDKGSFKNDKREGYWERYNDDGTTNKDLTGTYKNGIKISDYPLLYECMD